MKEKKSQVLSIRRTRFLGHCYKKRASKAMRFLAAADRRQGLEGGLANIKEQTLRLPYQLSILWRGEQDFWLRMSAYSHTLSYCWERRPCYSGEYSLRRASQKLCSNSTLTVLSPAQHLHELSASSSVVQTSLLQRSGNIITLAFTGREWYCVDW